MSQIHIKQIRNLPSAGNFSTILFDGNANVWSNNATTALRLPAGTNLQRPATPPAGIIRFNTDSNEFEGFDGTNWNPLGGSSNILKQTFQNADLTGGIFQWLHNQNINEIGIVQVYDNNNILINPDSITFVNPNRVDINIQSFVPIIGTWTVALLL